MVKTTFFMELLSKSNLGLFLSQMIDFFNVLLPMWTVSGLLLGKRKHGEKVTQKGRI